jgi:hypothetical protein
MTMGPWGQHYERTQTWWEWLRPWHDYLARCQFLLRQGRFVADLCYLQAESPPQGFANHPRKGYDWDDCSAEVVLKRMSVRNGRLGLPDGMSYRVLVLPDTRTMTPALLRKVKGLVEAGATVVGTPPEKSPSLSGYPDCDAEVRQLAAELWGDCDGTKVKARQFGKGRIVWTTEAESVLRQSGVAEDFLCDQPWRYLHRTVDGADLYFVANPKPHRFDATATFRVSGKIPELWWPESGRRELAAVFQEKGGRTSVALTLEPSGSVFVVFRAAARNRDPVVTLMHGGQPVFSAQPKPAVNITIDRAVYGPAEDPQRTRDVRDRVRRKVEDGETSFPALAMAEGDDPAPGVVKTLTVDYRIDGRSYSVKAQDSATLHLTPDALKIAVNKARYGVLDDPKRTRDVREKLQRLVDAGESSFQVARMAAGDDPAFLVVKTLELEYTRDGRHFSTRGTDPDVIDLKPPSWRTSERVAELQGTSPGRATLLAYQPGRYELRTAGGQRREVEVSSALTPIQINGPWTVRFAPGWGAPAEARFETLLSWSAHPDAGVRYFSGAATYAKNFTVRRELLAQKMRLHLDLGRVEVMANVTLNGKALGLLWKAPFRVDITDAAKAGENRLEITVVNLWPNRLIGDEKLAEDSERNPDGTLKRWPDWLLQGKPSPTGRHTFTSWRLWKKDDPLLDSGLLGPVQLQPAQRVELPWRFR